MNFYESKNILILICVKAEASLDISDDLNFCIVKCILYKHANAFLSTGDRAGFVCQYQLTSLCQLRCLLYCTCSGAALLR